jgi:hypothetical protein
MEYYYNIVAISWSIAGRKLIATGNQQFTGRVAQGVSVFEVLYLLMTGREKGRGSVRPAER